MFMCVLFSLAFVALTGTVSTSAHTAALLPTCTAYQPPEQVNSFCTHIFTNNQAISISPTVYYVWLRSAASSNAGLTSIVYSFNQPLFRIATVTPRWDGYQWWWNIRATNNSRVAGWVEQASLVAGVVRATPPPDTVVTTQAAFQPFERGYMLWTANDERVYVMGGAFAASHSLSWYEIASYRNSPDPVVPAPAGLFTPIRGFLKVWGNPRNTLPSLIGWGTAAETSVTATVTTHTIYDQSRLTPTVYVSEIKLSNGLVFKIETSRGAYFWTVQH